MKKQPIIYAFIDSQNLNLAIRDQGWKLDFAKFRRYLKEKYLNDLESKLQDKRSFSANKKKRPHKDKTLQGYSSVRDKTILAKRRKYVKK